MAEQHGYELVPAGEALGAFLCPMLTHEAPEFRARSELEQLTEQTRLSYHRAEALLFWSVAFLVGHL